MDDIKISCHTEQMIVASDDDDLFVVGRPCCGLYTRVYCAYNDNVWRVECESSNVTASEEYDE